MLEENGFDFENTTHFACPQQLHLLSIANAQWLQHAGVGCLG